MAGISSAPGVPLRSGGNSKQMLFLGMGIIVVVVVTYFTYRYFTQGVGENAPVVRTEEAASTQDAAIAGNDNLPAEAKRVLEALDVLKTITALDTKFFENSQFRGLTERRIVVPEGIPRPGRIFELWEVGPADRARTTSPTPPPPSPSTTNTPSSRLRR